jgi:hypothetical protein
VVGEVEKERNSFNLWVKIASKVRALLQVSL